MKTSSCRDTIKGADYGFADQNKPDLLCQPMLYDPMVEPNSSTLLLQPSPSESGSQTTTDEYSYRRSKWNNTGCDQRTNRGRKQQRTPPNASATICSKSSTASSQISNHSRASARTLETGQALPHNPYLNNINNGSGLFQLNEQMNSSQMQQPFESFERDSPPPPAPGFAPNPGYPSYSVYGQLANHNKQQPMLNRNLLANRQHHTLNNRNNKSHRQPNFAQSRLFEFEQLQPPSVKQFDIRDGPSVNLISNPLNAHRCNATGLQGSLPSLAECEHGTNNLNSHPSNHNRPSCVAVGELQGGDHDSLKATSNGLQSDNLYCEIEDAQRVQSDFRRQLQRLGCAAQQQPQHQQHSDSDQQSIYYAGSEIRKQNAEQQRLAEENDRLISRAVRDLDDDDDEDAPQIDTGSEREHARIPTFFGSMHMGRSNKILERRVNQSPEEEEEEDENDNDDDRKNVHISVGRINPNAPDETQCRERLLSPSEQSRLHRSPIEQDAISSYLRNHLETGTAKTITPPSPRRNKIAEPMASFFRFND